MKTIFDLETKIYNCIDDACDSVYLSLLENGVESAPRGMIVKELIGQSVTFDMNRPIITKPSRQYGYKFAPAEAAWILSGDNRLETIKRYSQFIWEFSDDGFFYQGAYGPRVVDQLSYVCDALSDDRDTRQAVIEVWRPNPRAGRDIPCTLSYQFLARAGRLHCVQSMRSSDAWLGYAYDAFNAAMLTIYIILLLRDRKTRGCTPLLLGNHTLVVGSQHLYERNWQGADIVIVDHKRFEYDPIVPDRFDSPQELIDWLWASAEAVTGIRERINWRSI